MIVLWGKRRIAFYAGRLLVVIVLLRRIVKPPVYIGVVYIPNVVQGLNCTSFRGSSLLSMPIMPLCLVHYLSR